MNIRFAPSSGSKAAWAKVLATFSTKRSGAPKGRNDTAFDQPKPPLEQGPFSEANCVVLQGLPPDHDAIFHRSNSERWVRISTTGGPKSLRRECVLHCFELGSKTSEVSHLHSSRWADATFYETSVWQGGTNLTHASLPASDCVDRMNSARPYWQCSTLVRTRSKRTSAFEVPTSTLCSCSEGPLPARSSHLCEMQHLPIWARFGHSPHRPNFEDWYVLGRR